MTTPAGRRSIPAESRSILDLAGGPRCLAPLTRTGPRVTTEVGRQPWVVYEVMLTRQAVTGASGIPVGYGTLVAVYLLLAGATAWVLRRLARAPLAPLADQRETAGGS